MKNRRMAVALGMCLSFSVLAQTTGFEVSNLNISKSTLGKNKISAVTFALPGGDDPVSWRLSCKNADIDGWESPKPVNIIERSSAGKISVVEGKNFPAGTRLKINLRRPEGTQKGESGNCKVVVFPANEGPKNADQGSYISLSYK